MSARNKFSASTRWMRMVVFSAILLLIIVFFRNGLFGTKELSWSAIGRRLRKMSGHGEVKG